MTPAVRGVRVLREAPPALSNEFRAALSGFPSLCPWGWEPCGETSEVHAYFVQSGAFWRVHPRDDRAWQSLGELLRGVLWEPLADRGLTRLYGAAVDVDHDEFGSCDVLVTVMMAQPGSALDDMLSW